MTRRKRTRKKKRQQRGVHKSSVGWRWQQEARRSQTDDDGGGDDGGGEGTGRGAMLPVGKVYSSMPSHRQRHQRQPVPSAALLRSTTAQHGQGHRDQPQELQNQQYRRQGWQQQQCRSGEMRQSAASRRHTQSWEEADAVFELALVFGDAAQLQACLDAGCDPDCRFDRPYYETPLGLVVAAAQDPSSYLQFLNIDRHRHVYQQGMGVSDSQQMGMRNLAPTEAVDSMTAMTAERTTTTTSAAAAATAAAAAVTAAVTAATPTPTVTATATASATGRVRPCTRTTKSSQAPTPSATQRGMPSQDDPAPRRQHLECIRLLLARGAKVDATFTSVNGTITCLHEAILQDNADAAALLVDAGATRMVMPGYSALELAVTKGATSCEELLLKDLCSHPLLHFDAAARAYVASLQRVLRHYVVETEDAVSAYRLLRANVPVPAAPAAPSMAGTTTATRTRASTAPPSRTDSQHAFGDALHRGHAAVFCNLFASFGYLCRHGGVRREQRGLRSGSFLAAPATSTFATVRTPSLRPVPSLFSMAYAAALHTDQLKLLSDDHRDSLHASLYSAAFRSLALAMQTNLDTKRRYDA
ncbi:hypothetical protein PTSG_07578 [Salpingoeca rosetta]|uniref:Uncharacterized protein n=1 Tax=Salpingoeca rosetta (strain ATCC 50818 / BSB-021) TaxID=946362 RepID=F2UH61_SALR5|nr:uncharacterized protein PTSG_07578 [Salpingoeca rosetta]EGD76460.1 hypothetical protein PTSG_07578 [Salpingoeca rosetta]|eukprot:XP_004991375.1 hypothetical protein PTSG_07578 [Salpingoeca rosetta]